MNRLIPTSFAFLLLLSAVGCSYVKTPVVAFNDDGQYLPRDVGQGLVASPTPLIPDVPMPVGFKAVASQCNWQYDGNVRVVQHLYQGHAEPGDAAAFYQRTLPGYDWSLVDIQSVDDATILRFTKRLEQLRISVEDGWAITTIAIEMGAN